MVTPEFEERDPKETQQATLCFLIREGEVLLAMKKRGFGKNFWNGVGGKVNDNEKLEDAVDREAKEEIRVELKNFRKVALLHFYFTNDPDKANWNQDVHVYLSDDWTGEPKESDEMRPQWFRISEVPYRSMWSDDLLWLPRVLIGEKIEAWFRFDAENEVAVYRTTKLGS